MTTSICKVILHDLAESDPTTLYEGTNMSVATEIFYEKFAELEKHDNPEWAVSADQNDPSGPSLFKQATFPSIRTKLAICLR